MVKGYICFNSNEIPFVIEDYILELFSNDDSILSEFWKTYNGMKKYKLEGKICEFEGSYRKIECLVEYSLGSTCYLNSYTISIHSMNLEYDQIVFESDQLDSIFKYKYNYLDLSRNGTNLSSEAKSIYTIPFSIDNRPYDLKYMMGSDFQLGLLEKFELTGKTVITLKDRTIEECSLLIKLMHRFMIFMISHGEIGFTDISLLHNGHMTGKLYCSLMNKKHTWADDMAFCDFDVELFIPRILQNLALDLDQKVTHSVPLGHYMDKSVPYTPNLFIEMINSFEYLFEKFEPEKSRDRNWPLKKELELMFNRFHFPKKNKNYSSAQISDGLKELRRKITHGYEYYYEIENPEIQYFIIQLDCLLRVMSLKFMGFTDEEIKSIRCFYY